MRAVLDRENAKQGRAVASEPLSKGYLIEEVFSRGF
jgi:hypothetical protein